MSKVIGIDLGTTFSAIASLDDMGNLKSCLVWMKIEKLLRLQFMLITKR